MFPFIAHNYCCQQGDYNIGSGTCLSQSRIVHLKICHQNYEENIVNFVECIIQDVLSYKCPIIGAAKYKSQSPYY